MITKQINIDGKEYTMRSSALVPRLYRAQFGRDMVSDMRQLSKAYQRALEAGASEEEQEAAQLSVLDLEIFENVAWIMLKHGGEDVGNSPEEWLDQLDGVFSVYSALPEILELWKANNLTTSVSRKK